MHRKQIKHTFDKNHVMTPLIVLFQCMALHERLQLATAQRSMAKEKLQSAESALVRLQEELHTTTHNYETQLSLMSEHLANMNEKLAVQRDEIDQLKYQLGQKVSHFCNYSYMEILLTFCFTFRLQRKGNKSKIYFYTSKNKILFYIPLLCYITHNLVHNPTAQ
jgi:exonuclease VII large subunit